MAHFDEGWDKKGYFVPVHSLKNNKQNPNIQK